MLDKFNSFCIIFTIIIIIVGYLLKLKKKQFTFVTTTNEEWNFKLSYRTSFIILALFALLLRIWKLSDYPAGINVDEAGMAYDAFCLSNFGVDRFLNWHPLYLINYGGGQSAVYSYICALFIKFFGVSIFVLRIPAVLSGMSVLIFGGLISKITYGKKISILTVFLITICPYFITTSRFGLDCNLLLGFSMISLYCLIKAVQSQKISIYLLTGFMYGITIYTYSLSWIIIPIFLVLTLIYLIYTKNITLKQLMALCIPIFILALPLFSFIYINTYDKSSVITPFFTIPKLPNYRIGEMGSKNFEASITAFRRILTTDDSQFFSFDSYYTLFEISIPLVLLGFFVVKRNCIDSIERRKTDYTVIIFCYFIAALICAMLLVDSNIYRNNSIYFSLILFVAVAIFHICQRFKYKKLVFYSLIALYSINFISFIQFYYSDKILENHPIVWFSNDYIDDIYSQIKNNSVECDVFIDDLNLTSYCYGLLEYEVDPNDFIAQGNNAWTQDFNYNNLHFYLPDDPAEIRLDAIYVVCTYNNYNTNFDSLNFDMVTHGYFNIYYTNNTYITE